MNTIPEPKVMHEVVDRVADRLPNVDREVVTAEVSAQFQEYSDSTVRDFLPILVERAVIARIRARGPVVPA